MTQSLSYNAASSMAEMLRLPRDLILSSIQLGLLLDSGLNYLKTAPFTADTLFGGRIQSAVTADREDQIHASLARSNVSLRPGAFKRPAPKPLLKYQLPKRPRNTTSLIGALLFRPLLLEGLLRTRGLRAKVDPSRIQRCQRLLPARAAPLRVSPRGPPFCCRLHPCKRYQSEPDFFTSNNDGSKSPRHMGSLSSFKRPNFPVRKKASTFPCPHRISISASEHSRLHSRTSRKTGSGKGTRPTFSRFLQLYLSSTKEEWLLETGHRSQSVQHLLLKPTFKMETLAFIRNSTRPMHWRVSLDLEDALFHVPIHPNFRKYLRFAFQGQVYQFWAMPFGLAISQRVFTKLMAAVGAHLRVHGVLLTSVLRQLAPSPARSSTTPSEPRVCLEGTPLLRTLSQCIQVRPHPSQDFTFVGMNFLTHLNRVRVLHQRVSDLIAWVKWVLTQSHITAQDFLSLNGILSSVANFVLLGQLFLRTLQHYLSSLWVSSPDDLLAQIPILRPLGRHLQWWLVEETF